LYHLAASKQGRNGKREELCRLRLNVLYTCNVEENALYIYFRKRVGVEVNADHDGIPFYIRNTVIAKGAQA
jgi:hypothetical protein